MQPLRAWKVLLLRIRVLGCLVFVLALCDCQLLCQVFHCSSTLFGCNTNKKSRPVDWDECTRRIEPRKELSGKARELAYQVDLGRACTAIGDSECNILLAARVNVDSFTAASQLVAGAITPAQYLALKRDRSRKSRAAEKDPQLGIRLCTDNDADGDLVPDALDKCPNTPDLSATDDTGCPDSTLPRAPGAEDMKNAFARLNWLISPKCKDAPAPNEIKVIIHPDIFMGIGIYIKAATNQPADCPVWYQFEVQSTKERIKHIGNPALSTVFTSKEGKTSFDEHKNQHIYFYVNYKDSGIRGQLARISVDDTPFRARAINGNGQRGPWSSWKLRIN